MEFVKLQCNICFSVAEIKNYHLQLLDRLNIIPVLELDTCKHQLCSMCIRKIRKRKRIQCPLCRVESLHFNVYSVNRNVVDVIKCTASSVAQWNKANDNFDAASLASVLFEKSLLDDTEDNDASGNATALSDLQLTLKKLKTDIAEQAQFNIKQKLAVDKLQQAYVSMQEKFNVMKTDYNNMHKSVKELQLKRITAEKTLKSLSDDYAKLFAKNTKLSSENKILSNKNIELIKHKNLLQNEYTELQQKTYKYVTNATITTNVTINVD
ncbi:cg30 protein [Thysanoplusia orichalcea nucleopolyhedrovirus]|uniref:Cg30 protein n=1 Tax=Thysanoplusia orichalcea nucleopolyhedrovirus TaxID=101850 RepID=L0CJT4_9ABAC|nr:cg30 protein [Thysanoplusia orichalcea nucleopolyhedrovirus]AGA16239.1 cg30 protein [Thysanoplusia orichalcea nucleopolyhedrovirus]